VPLTVAVLVTVRQARPPWSPGRDTDRSVTHRQRINIGAGCGGYHRIGNGESRDRLRTVIDDGEAIVDAGARAMLVMESVQGPAADVLISLNSDRLGSAPT